MSPVVFRRLFAFAALAAGAPSVMGVPGSPLVLQPIYQVGDIARGFKTTATSPSGPRIAGQIAYLAKTPSPGAKALYRYAHMATFASRDSTALPFPWVKAEFLGYTLPRQADLVRLVEYGDAKGHFVTLNEHEAAPVGYSYRCDLGYAYERFDRSLTRLMKIKAGGVEVDFDRVSGGCIWHIVDQGVQLVNNCYYGRQGCVALEFWPAGETFRYCPCDCGLTTASSRWIYDPASRMGAPCPVFAFNGSTFVTRTIPIESTPEVTRSLGGSAWNPVVYPDMPIEKRAVLGLRGHDGVLQYKVNCVIPTGELAGIRRTRVNILGLHLCYFMDRLALYDPAADVYAEQAGWTVRTGAFARFQRGYARAKGDSAMNDYTCVVMHDQSGHAVGLMGAAPGHGPNGGGSVEYFLGYDWQNWPSGVAGTPEFTSRTIMMTAMSERPFHDGANNYCLYVLIGSPAEVRSDARDLYQNRTTLDW